MHEWVANCGETHSEHLRGLPTIMCRLRNNLPFDHLLMASEHVTNLFLLKVHVIVGFSKESTYGWLRKAHDEETHLIVAT